MRTSSTTQIHHSLADVLRFANNLGSPQVRLQHAPKQLQQHLKAHLGDGRVVAALAQLVADEGVLGPGELVEGGGDAGLAQLGADEVAALGGDVGVLDAEDHGDLGVREGRQQVEGVRAALRGGRGGVLGRVRAEGAGVDVGCEVGDAGVYARVELVGVLGA